jgi:RHS repeat-associated protein
VQSSLTDGSQTITTVYIGSYYEQITTSGAVTATDWNKYYYAGAVRLAMRENSEEPYYLISDHLGGTSLVVDSLGQEVARRSYLPFGEEWGSSVTDLPTTFTYTGQREAAEIGLHYYIARWYDAGIGHFLQADTIVPGVGNPMAWNRYGYTYFNPTNYVDPDGHLTCDDEGFCFIDGWNVNYQLRQVGNTCAVVSITVALSILTEHKYTQENVQPYFWSTYFGIGVVPKIQEKVINENINFIGIDAEYSVGTRENLLSNIKNDIPTVVTFSLPIRKGVGHSVLAIGIDKKIQEIIYFNPATKSMISESQLAKDYSINNYGFEMTFDELWANENLFLSSNSMVSIQLSSFWQVKRGGGSNWIIRESR